MKLLLDNFNDLNHADDAVIYGITPFSYGLVNTSIDKLKAHQGEVFLYFNALVAGDDLEQLNSTLALLDNTKIKVIFEDYAVLNLCKKHHYNIDLYLGQTAAVTSSALINNSDPLIKGALITANLPIEELTNIIKNANKELIVYGYGYLNLFYSKRLVLSNYLKTVNLKRNKEANYQINNNEINYPLFEAESVSMILSDKIYHIVNELSKLDASKIKYLYLAGFNIPQDIKEEDLKQIRQKLKDPSFNITLSDNYSTYQLYNPNHYKVKHHE